jgi:hypothetical protein
MDAEAMRTIARTTTDGFRRVEEWPPEAAQDAVRALAVMEYQLLTTMHHLEVAGTPGTDGLFTARRGAAMAVEYFFGSWREDFEYSNWADEPVEHWDAAKCRAGLAWFDAWREGLFCACVADDADALAALWRWPGADLAHDEGSWDAPQQENDFHVLLALTVRDEKADERGRLHKRIKESRRQRPKLWLAGLDAIVARDPAAVVAALRQMLAYGSDRDRRDAVCGRAAGRGEREGEGGEMSYTVILYALSIERLRGAIGGGDAQVLEGVRKELKGRGPSPERVSLAEGLVNRGVAGIGGATADEVGLALELVCGGVGRRLPSAELGETSVSFLAALARMWPWAGMLLGSRMPVDLPAAVDFPVIGYLTRDEIDRVFAGWDDAVLDEVDAEIAAGCAAMLEAMGAARESGVDLVAFTI